MTVIYLEDDSLDLFPDTVIAITVQRNDVQNLTSRSVSRTNEIQIPPTQNNLKLFGIESDNSAPSQITYNCKVVINGYEVISYGSLTLVTNDKRLSIRIFDADIDYFDRLKGLTAFQVVKESSYAFGDSIWNSAGIEAVRNSTDGVIAPVCDQGNGFDMSFLWPHYHYKNFIKAIGELISIDPTDISSDSLLNEDIQDLAIFTVPEKLEYTDDFSEVFDLTAVSVGTQNLVANGDVTFITSVTSQGTVDIYNEGAGYIEMASNTAAEVSVIYSITGSFSNPDPVLVATGTLQLVRDRGGVITVLDTKSTSILPLGSIAVPNTYSSTVEIEDGDIIKMRFVQSALSPTCSLTAASVILTASTRVYRDRLFFDYLSKPTLTALDFARDWAVRFAVVFKLNSDGYLNVRKMNDILSDRQNAVDWSSKFESTGKKTYQSKIDGKGYFNYSDNKDTPFRGRGFVQGGESTNEFDIYTSPFDTCVTQSVSNVNASLFNVYEVGAVDFYDVANGVDPVLVSLRDKLADEPAQTYFSSQTDYKVSYFTDSRVTQSTNWQYFIDQNYAVFSDSIAQAGLVERFYNLTEKDIFEFDQFKMIFDNGQYYLVNKIDNFVQGKVTRVELLMV